MNAANLSPEKAGRAVMEHIVAAIQLANAPADSAALELFEDEPVATCNLAEILAKMEAQGYLIGTPERQAHCAKPWHTEWHFPITKGDVTWKMAFQIPADVS